MVLLIAAGKPFAGEVHQHICIKCLRQQQRNTTGTVIYRCFLSAAARAVASSTISGRNGMHRFALH
jgi:hypothetical protein